MITSRCCILLFLALANTTRVTATLGFADLNVYAPDSTEIQVPQVILDTQSQFPVPTSPRFPKDASKDKASPLPLSRDGVQVRIVGGDIVNSTEAYPFFVHTPQNGCGASLIYQDIVLGAAHCENTWATELPAYINAIRRYEGIYRTITRQITHPLWNPFDGTLDYDYMIMKLDSSALVDQDGMETGATTVPLNLDGDIPATDETLTAIGMGLTSDTDWYPSDELREADVQAVSNDICFDLFGIDLFVPDIMICTDGDGKGSCFGDSGGPLLTQDGHQVGIVSYGPGGCPKDKSDAVYARVSGVQNWIHQQICQLSDNPPDDCEDIGTPPPQSGPGAMTINIMTDNFGWETSFVLKNTQSGEEHWNVPFGNLTSDTLFSAPSEDLPVGNYTLEVRDSGYDGICCRYGQGYFWVQDDNNDQVVYQNPGHFFDYVLVKMYIDDTGKTNFVSGSYYPDYPSPDDPSDIPNYPQQNDEAWPGPEPTEANSLFVNVKFDRYPQETTWELSYRNQEDEWDLLEAFDGAEDGVHNDVVSTQFMNLEPGWFKLLIEDSDGDGICCAYRRGWVALTGILEVTQATGLVWGNNGEYGYGMVVYFEMDEDGLFKNLALDEEMMDRMMSGRRTKKQRKREL